MVTVIYSVLLLVDYIIVSSPTSKATSTLEFWIPILLAIGLAVWNLVMQRNIQELKKSHDRQLFVHQLQFEKEFGIYSELWGKLVDLRKNAYKLRPIADATPVDETYEETIKKRIEETEKTANDFINLTEKNKPFYEEKVYEKLQEIVLLIEDELFDVWTHYLEKPRPKDYFKKGEENFKKLLEKIENVNVEIRARIYFK